MNADTLKALYINCSLKRTPRLSHTDALIDKSRIILENENIQTEVIRAVDHDIAFGVQPDMTQHGWEQDGWPPLFETINDSDIVILTSPIWLGNMSAVATQVIERLYAHSAQTNEKGQYIYYNKVGGALVTGNEDGGKHVCRDLLYGLQHIGFTIPPQADAYWVGEAGPGPSYRDKGSNANENEFTNRNVKIMTWNLIHFARMLREHGGIPAKGNIVEK